MIVTIGGIKGGCGKSLISTNLAVMQASKKKKVLLIDADEQGTTSDWVGHRESLGIHTSWTTVKLSGISVKTEVRKLRSNYDVIIIDCGGRDTISLRAALTISDILLVPFQPNSFDVWTAEKMSELINQALVVNDNLNCYAVINCAGHRGTYNDETKKILSKIVGLKLLDQTIGLRRGFTNATSEGLGITEMIGNEKAKDEMLVLNKKLFGK